MARLPLVFILSLMVGVATACNSQSPTTAGGSGPMIRSIQPTVMFGSAQTQTVTVNGEDFSNGMSLLVTTPAGNTRTVPAEALDGLTTTTFRTSLLFDTLGSYSLVVRSVSGTNSPAFVVAVQATVSG